MNESGRSIYERGYRDGESNLLADVATLCEQLDIEVGDRHEFDAIRDEIELLRGRVAESFPPSTRGNPCTGPKSGDGGN